MALATGSRVQTLYIPEVTWGTTPSSPDMTFARITSNTLALEKPMFQSKLLRQDRQQSDVRYGVHSVKGNLDSELIYGDEALFVQAALCGAWAQKFTKTTAETDVSVVASTGVYTSAALVTFTGRGWAVGDWVKVDGFTNTGNNGMKQITAITTHSITLVGGTLVNESAGQSVTFQDSALLLTQGTTNYSFSVERGHLDISQYFPFTGVLIDTWDLDAKPAGIVTVNRGCLGMALGTITTSTEAGSTTDATTNEPMDSLTGSVSVAGTSIAVISAIKLGMKNQISLAEVVGSKSPVGFFPGRLLVSGSLSAYFQDATLINDFINETELNVTFTLEDIALNSYTFELPRVKLSKADVPVSQEKGLVIDLPYEALLDYANTNNTVMVTDNNPTGATLT